MTTISGNNQYQPTSSTTSTNAPGTTNQTNPAGTQVTDHSQNQPKTAKGALNEAENRHGKKEGIFNQLLSYASEISLRKNGEIAGTEGAVARGLYQGSQQDGGSAGEVQAGTQSVQQQNDLSGRTNNIGIA